jgi:hypothetical protein
MCLSPCSSLIFFYIFNAVFPSIFTILQLCPERLCHGGKMVARTRMIPTVRGRLGFPICNHGTIFSSTLYRSEVTSDFLVAITAAFSKQLLGGSQTGTDIIDQFLDPDFVFTVYTEVICLTLTKKKIFECKDLTRTSAFGPKNNFRDLGLLNEVW